MRACTRRAFRARISAHAAARPRRPTTVRAIARRFEADLGASVLASGPRIPNVRQISERVAMGRALWRELVVGFASQLGELRLGFTQLAALYVLADGSTTTVGELAEALGRSPSATSRLVDGLAKRRLVERREEPEDRRQRSLALTQRGQAILRAVDRARADQFLTTVRPMPTPERALVAMGVAALATHAISRRGRLIRGRRASAQAFMRRQPPSPDQAGFIRRQTQRRRRTARSASTARIPAPSELALRRDARPRCSDGAGSGGSAGLAPGASTTTCPSSSPGGRAEVGERARPRRTCTRTSRRRP